MFCDLHHGSLTMVLAQIVLAGDRIGDLCCGEEFSEIMQLRCCSHVLEDDFLISSPFGDCLWVVVAIDVGELLRDRATFIECSRKVSDLILGDGCFRMMCNIHLVCERILWFDNVCADERLLAVR